MQSLLVLRQHYKRKARLACRGIASCAAAAVPEECDDDDVGNLEDRYAYLLRRCRNPVKGREIHAQAAKDGLDVGSFVGSALLRMYGKCGCIDEAKQAFGKVASKNVFLWNAMVTAFAQNEHLVDARKCFDEMPVRSVVSWNSMIVAYASNGSPSNGFKLWLDMNLEGEKPSRATFLAVLGASSSEAQVGIVRAVASEAGYERDVPVATAMIDVYGKLGLVERAREVFDGMSERNVVSWTAMLFALSTSEELLEDARRHFDDMPIRNSVSWNVMLGAYVRRGKNREALELFKAMDLEGFEADGITFAAVLEACGNTESILEGRAVHEAMSSRPLDQWDSSVTTELVSMYARCGRVEEAREVFEVMSLEQKNSSSVSWTILIGGYAKLGMLGQACQLMAEMCVQGFLPTEVLFISLLAGCTHAGLLEESRGIFATMIGDYELQPAMEHYVCVADLMGRMGRLEEAREIVEAMPYEPDVKAWKAFLSSCGSHGDLGKGLEAAGLALRIDKSEHSPYVLLSNAFKQSTI